LPLTTPINPKYYSHHEPTSHLIPANLLLSILLIMDTTTVTDSTDWLPTPLSALAPLESSLRCQVCKDFFTTPMMTSCSHTFCSLCIRRYLSQEGKCPACRENDQEVKLRRNWVVEELVENFKGNRGELLEFAVQAGQRAREEVDRRPAKKRKVNGANLKETRPPVERRSTRSQTRRNASQVGASQQTPVSTQEEISDSEDDAGSVYEGERTMSNDFDGTSEPHDGLVACPSCTCRMKESLVNAHLDKCLAGLADEPPSTPAVTNGIQTSQSPHPPHVKAGTIAYGQTKPSQSQRLPTLNYSLFNENSLRKKLKEYGIPNHGSKQLMMKRHTEWFNLYNANCDSSHPVSLMELRKTLNEWERTLGRQVDNKGPSGVMAKDFDRDRYAQRQRSEFDELIGRARANRGVRIAAVEEEKAAEPAEARICSTPELAINLDGPLDDPEEPQLSNGVEPESSSPVEDVATIEDRTEPVITRAAFAPVHGAHWQQSEHLEPPRSSQRSMNHDIMA
jgi:E3 ubiquitin-protein ligase RAD18